MGHKPHLPQTAHHDCKSVVQRYDWPWSRMLFKLCFSMALRLSNTNGFSYPNGYCPTQNPLSINIPLPRCQRKIDKQLQLIHSRVSHQQENNPPETTRHPYNCPAAREIDALVVTAHLVHPGSLDHLSHPFIRQPTECRTRFIDELMVDLSLVSKLIARDLKPVYVI